MSKSDKKVEIKYYKNTISNVVIGASADTKLPSAYKQISEKEYAKLTNAKLPDNKQKKTAIVKNDNAEPSSDNLSEWKKYALTIKSITDKDLAQIKTVDEIKELIKLAK
jgi:hypothetical protein